MTVSVDKENMKAQERIATSPPYLLGLSLCVIVRVFTFIQKEDLICSKQLECQGTDQRCCVGGISFLLQVHSSLL